MRFLEGRFKDAAAAAAAPAAAARSFWELQDRETGNHYRAKVSRSGAGTRGGDLQIFHFVRDRHRSRPGSVALVTNDRPLAIEAASVGVCAVSSREFFARPARGAGEPCQPAARSSCPARKAKRREGRGTALGDSPLASGEQPAEPSSCHPEARVQADGGSAGVEVEGVGGDDSDCVVTKVTRVEDKVECIVLSSDEEEQQVGCPAPV